MRLKILFFLSILFSGLALAVSPVRAALSYGSGYYTNLCESGTAATYYNCDPGCDPTTGSCRSDNQGVVKWVCGGKWNQCLESESQWSNFEQLGNVGCGYTVQLSKFDQKCRREDGSWNSNCQLLGYMVWYSGDCGPGWQQTVPVSVPQTTSVPAKTPTPTTGSGVTSQNSTESKLSAVLTVTPTKKPTPTVTPVPADKVCGLVCSQATDCEAGFACVSGYCRNPACTSDTTCFCAGGAATNSAVTDVAPDTGWEVWAGMGLMLVVGWGGLILRRTAKRMW